MDNNEFSRSYRDTISTTLDEDYSKAIKETNVETNKNYDFETDDYSVDSNFKEETGYDIKNKVQSFSEHEQETFSFFKPINIERKTVNEQEQVALTRMKQRFYLGGRMKIVLSTFIVIMVSLMVAIIWNFTQLARLNTSITEKEIQINELQNSISNMNEEYKFTEENTKMLAEASGYVQVTDENTKFIQLGEMHTEAKPASIPSNWFNDVCNFLIKVFN